MNTQSHCWTVLVDGFLAKSGTADSFQLASQQVFVFMTDLIEPGEDRKVEVKIVPTTTYKEAIELLQEMNERNSA